MDRVDAVVIGAGVVGLAVARSLALAGHEVIVLEAADTIGSGISSRNSEVIHAGIYYPTDSLKARLCVAGREALYRYCDEHGVPYRRCGKLIVATDTEQTDRLRAIRDKAAANGVTDLALLHGPAARALEPNLFCVAALLSPSTGIVDSHALMLAYLGEAEARGGVLVRQSPVIGGWAGEEGIVLEVGGAAPCLIRARYVVNAAGLQAPDVARSIRGMPASGIPVQYLAKGNYFALSGRAPFSRLIYPVPEPGGLGVHLTLDLGGQARFGPDVEWVDAIGYEVDPGRAARFYGAIRRYWPDLADGALQPAYAGIRPKLAGPGQPDADFRIQGPRAHGIRGLVNLYGIESPGLTASLALGRWAVAELGLIPGDPESGR